MSNVEQLREAAKILRKRAQKATRGPWVMEDCEGDLKITAGAASTVWENGIGRTPHRYPASDLIYDHWLETWDEGEDITDDQRRSDAAYVAAVNPSLGLAIADLLDAEADSQAAHAHDSASAKSEAIRTSALRAVALILAPQTVGDVA